MSGRERLRVDVRLHLPAHASGAVARPPHERSEVLSPKSGEPHKVVFAVPGVHPVLHAIRLDHRFVETVLPRLINQTPVRRHPYVDAVHARLQDPVYPPVPQTVHLRVYFRDLTRQVVVLPLCEAYEAPQRRGDSKTPLLPLMLRSRRAESQSAPSRCQSPGHRPLRSRGPFHTAPRDATTTDRGVNESPPYASTIPHAVLMKSPASSAKSVVTTTNRSVMFKPVNRQSPYRRPFLHHKLAVVVPHLTRRRLHTLGHRQGSVDSRVRPVIVARPELQVLRSNAGRGGRPFSGVVSSEPQRHDSSSCQASFSDACEDTVRGTGSPAAPPPQSARFH